MATMDEVKEESAREVVHKMKTDDEYAESVIKAIADNPDHAEAMLDDTALASKMVDHLLTDDAGLMSKVRGELEAEGFRIEATSDDEYTRDKAMRDFQIIAKAVTHNEDPERIAKACGVEVSKTMQETDATNAGLLIPEPMLDEIVPILTASSVFMEAGPVVVELGQNKIGIGRQNQDPTAAWGDENATISESDADFDKLQLDGKKLRIAMSVSNDFLRRDAVVAAEDFLAERMLVVMMNKLETAFFRGTGTQHQPAGILQSVDSSHVNSSGGNSITNVTDDAREAVQQLERANVPDNRRSWFMRREVYVDLIFDVNSNEDTFPFREEMAENNTLFGDTIRQTNNIEKRTNDSNIYYVEMSEQYVGRGTDFTLDSADQTRFLDDETLLKMIGHFDFEMKHDKSASVIEDYTLQTA